MYILTQTTYAHGKGIDGKHRITTLELELRIVPAAKKKDLYSFMRSKETNAPWCNVLLPCTSSLVSLSLNTTENQSCVTMWSKPTGQEKMARMGWNLAII